MLHDSVHNEVGGLEQSVGTDGKPAPTRIHVYDKRNAIQSTERARWVYSTSIEDGYH